MKTEVFMGRMKEAMFLKLLLINYFTVNLYNRLDSFVCLFPRAFPYICASC